LCLGTLGLDTVLIGSTVEAQSDVAYQLGTFIYTRSPLGGSLTREWNERYHAWCSVVVTLPTPHLSAGYEIPRSSFRTSLKMVKKPDDEKRFSIRKFSGKKTDWPKLEEDAVTFLSKNNETYIGDYARCFFDKFKELAELAKTNKTVFYPILSKHDDAVWESALTSRIGVRATSRFDTIMIKWTKDTYGANWTKPLEVGFASKERFESARTTMIEDSVLSDSQTFLTEIRDATFPLGIKDDNAACKDSIRNAVKDPQVTEVIRGSTPDDIAEWPEKPWKNQAVIAWTSILWRYMGVEANVESNFMDEMEETIKSARSKDRKPIKDVDRELEELLTKAAKSFTTTALMVADMRCTALAKLIRQYSKESGPQQRAWELANNSLVSIRKANVMLSMTVINHAINIAQGHLAELDDEATEQVHSAAVKGDAEIEKLKQQISKQQQVIETLQTTATPAYGSQGAKRKGAPGIKPKADLTKCSTCNRFHFGSPPEKFCFEGIDKMQKELDELKARKDKTSSNRKGQKPGGGEKGGGEQPYKKRAAFIEEVNKSDSE
jgi:hypothetical protein